MYFYGMKWLEERIFKIKDEQEFHVLALEVFRFQATENSLYRQYLSMRKVDPEGVDAIVQIPFLPIGFFRERKVICGEREAEVVFESSGTTGQAPSRHHIASETLYNRSLLYTFRSFYGDPSERCILALLPSYLERGNSSLVYMMNQLIRRSTHPDSGFYLDDLKALSGVLKARSADGHPTLLVGVSFALLDLAEQFPQPLAPNITLMETGGMKGRRKELIRAELHKQLTSAFSLESVHSEYGMTELLSQAYSTGDALFSPPPWMRVLIRDTYDPFEMLPPGRSGGINIIDLANLYSCSFIETGDLGVVRSDGRFEVRGRYDQEEVRGCNLMVY
jgi:phenylacetate-coenzyme A ligase PaaK-like adenylate-forming protein